MKKIKFTCSPCGAKLRVPTHLAGVSAPCPKCGAIVTAPSDITQAVEENERSGRRKSTGSRKAAVRANRSEGGSEATSTAVLTAPPAARLPEPFVPAAPAPTAVSLPLASSPQQVTPLAPPVAKSRYAEPLPPLPVSLPAPILPPKLELPAVEPAVEEPGEIAPASDPEPYAQEDPEVYTSVALPPPNFGRKVPQPVPVESDSSTVFFAPPPPVPPAIEPEPEEIERAEAPMPLDDDVDIIVEEHFFDLTEPLPPAPTTQPVRVVTGLRDLLTPEFPSGESDLPRLDLSRAKLENTRSSLPTTSAPPSGRTKLVLPMPGSQVELTSPEDFLVRPTPPAPVIPPAAEPAPESLPEPLPELLPEPVFEAAPAVPEDQEEVSELPTRAEIRTDEAGSGIETGVEERTLPDPSAEASPEAGPEPLFEPLFEPEPPVDWIPGFLIGREEEVVPEPEAEVVPEPEAEVVPEPEAEVVPEPEADPSVELLTESEITEEPVADLTPGPVVENPAEEIRETDAAGDGGSVIFPDLLANFGKDFIDEPFPGETLSDDALEPISRADESVEWDAMPELFLQVYPELAQDEADLGLDAETEVEVESDPEPASEPEFDDDDFDPFVGVDYSGLIVSEPVLDLADIVPDPDLDTSEDWFAEASTEVASEEGSDPADETEIAEVSGPVEVAEGPPAVPPSWEITAPAMWEIAGPVPFEPPGKPGAEEPAEKKVIFEKLDSVEEPNPQPNPFEPDAVIRIPVRSPVRRPMAPLQNLGRKREEAPAVAEFGSPEDTLAPVLEPEQGPLHEQPAEASTEESDPASALEEMIFPPFEESITVNLPRSARPGLSRRQPVAAEAFGVPLNEGSVGRLFDQAPPAAVEATAPSPADPRPSGKRTTGADPEPAAKPEAERRSSSRSRKAAAESRRDETARGDVLDDLFDNTPDLYEVVDRRRKATVVLVTACATVAVSMVIGFILVVDAFLGGFSPKEDYAEVNPEPAGAPKVALPRIPTSTETADTATSLQQDEPAMVDPVARQRDDEPGVPVDSEAKKPTASSAFNQSIDAALGTKPAPASVIGSAALDWPTSGPGAAEKAAEEKPKAGTAEAEPAPESASGFAPTPLKTAEAGDPAGTAPRSVRSDDYNPPATFPAPGPGDSKLGKTHDVIDAFLRAPDVESRLRYTYHGESVRAAVEDYYKKWPFSQFGRFSLQLYQLETDTSVGGPYWVFIVSTSDTDDGFPLIVRIEDGLLKVDWEIFAEFSDRHFLRFREGKMAPPANLRVIMERFSDYYGSDRAEFTDLDKYYVYQAYPPYGDAAFTEFVFVEKDSEAGRELDKWIGLGSEPLAVIVTLDQKTFPHGKRHLVVTKWIADGWFR